MIASTLKEIKDLLLIFVISGLYAIFVMYIGKYLNLLPNNYFSYTEMFIITVVGVYVSYYAQKIIKSYRELETNATQNAVK